MTEEIAATLLDNKSENLIVFTGFPFFELFEGVVGWVVGFLMASLRDSRVTAFSICGATRATLRQLIAKWPYLPQLEH